MKPILRERDLARLSFCRHLLEEAGIPTFVRNEALSVTEAPIPNFLPTLCVVKDEDFEQALELIQRRSRELAETSTEERTCPACGEQVPGNFELCWNCGAAIAAAAG